MRTARRAVPTCNPQKAFSELCIKFFREIPCFPWTIHSSNPHLTQFRFAHSLRLRASAGKISFLPTLPTVHRSLLIPTVYRSLFTGYWLLPTRSHHPTPRPAPRESIQNLALGERLNVPACRRLIECSKIALHIPIVIARHWYISNPSPIH